MQIESDEIVESYEDMGPDMLREALICRDAFLDTLGSLLIEASDKPTNAEVLELLERVLVTSAELLDAQQGSLLMRNELNGELIFVLVHGDGPGSKLLGRCLPRGTGVVGWVGERNCHVVVNNTQFDDRFFAGFDSELSFETESIVAAPITAGRRVLGVVELLNKKTHGLFNQVDAARLGLVCRVAGSLMYQVIDETDVTGSFTRTEATLSPITRESKQEARREPKVVHRQPSACVSL